MSIPSSFIKNVAFPLRDKYEFVNTPWKDNWTEDPGNLLRPRFIGRKRHIDKLKGFLSRRKGVYLVTGYRGMGKTSFVNHTIGLLKREHADNNKKANATIIPVHLTIAQQRPAEIDILRQVAISVYDKVKEKIITEVFPKAPDKEGLTSKEKLIRTQRYFKLGMIGATALFLFISLLLIFNVPGTVPKADAAAENITYTLTRGAQTDTARIQNTVTNPPKPPSLARRTIHYMSSKIWYWALFLALISGWVRYFFNSLPLLRLRFRLADDELFVRVKWMAERAFTSVSEDITDGAAMPLQVEFKGVKGLFGAKAARRVKGFPVAGSKELEYELRMILEMAAARGYEFIFVFDELDKIDFPDGTANIYMDLDSYESSAKDPNFQSVMRNRKQAVMSIIAGLKNFFTTADAAFIFIAGREMFDASLADISDKQSPLSSIFTYTFNIESFLKEEEGFVGERSTSSLTNAIEEFVKYQLCTDEELHNDNTAVAKKDGVITVPDPNNPLKTINLRLRDISFFDYVKYAYGKRKGKSANANEPLTEEQQRKEKQECAKEFGKIYFTLQAFITFLAYRSNGSPKKILKSFHEFVRIKYQLLQEHPDQFIIGDRSNDKNATYALCFNYHDQCRIGFIYYFYRPFLIQHGRSFKLYSDNAVISVPYLFDHLFRFHPFAFSKANLELVPELLSSNKTPAIKEDLDQIITYLTNNHLRETNIQLFEYKFNSRFANEISFLSREFEEEAAAFNFTLDESYAVKLLQNEKIKELRSIYSRFNKDTAGSSGQIYSIAYHNGNLGDLHFFDQEYDDAIGNYSDAIRPINQIEVDKMNLRDFVSLIRNKLKIGLCLEKVNSFEEALSFFADAAQDAQRFITCRLEDLGFIESKDKGSNNQNKQAERPILLKTGAITNLLQIVIQSTFANIYLQEKLGQEGITTNKVKLDLSGFFELSQAAKKITGQNFLQTASFFYHMAKIAYYKNTRARLSTEIEDRTGVDIPLEYAPRFRGILRSLSRKIQQDGTLNSRQPTQAFVYYMIALDEAVRSRDIGKTDKSGEKKARLFLFTSNDYNKIDPYFAFFIDYLHKGYQIYTANHYRDFAGLITSIGDCLLSFCNLSPIKQKPDKTDIASDNNYWKVQLGEIFTTTEINIAAQYSAFLSQLNVALPGEYTIADTLRCYFLAARYYEKSGRLPSAIFEYKKILHTLRVILKENPGTDGDKKVGGATPAADPQVLFCGKIISLLEKEIVEPALALVKQSAGRSHRHMVLKAEDLIDASAGSSYIDQNIALHPDTREIMLLFEYIKVKLGINTSIIDDIIHPCNSIGTQFTRIMELNYYAACIYYGSLRKWLSEKRKGLTEAQPIADPKIKNDIIGYLFSNQSLIHSLNIYGPDYMVGHSFTAYTHYRIASFLRRAHIDNKDELDIMNAIDAMIGSGSKVYTDQTFHFGKASDHYEKALQLHTAGDEYRKTVRGMIFLEDDYSDSAYHFGAALDRFMLVRGVFDRQIYRCKVFKAEAGEGRQAGK